MQNNKYDTVIIGAGIGGLVCGCYLAKAGLKVLIVEQQDKPGGYCTSFERNGFKFDVGVHYLGGIKNGTLGKILDDLDLRKKIKFIRLDPADKIIMPRNITYIRTNPFNTIEEFKRSFPKEKNNIDKFFKLAMLNNFTEIYKKLNNIKLNDLLDYYFEDERLKSTLGILSMNIGTNSNFVSALFFVILLREFILDPGYYPIGGMQAFPDILQTTFKEQGGEILISTDVKQIIVKKGVAKAVILQNSERVQSNTIISNADVTDTFRRLLNIKSKEVILTLKNLKPSLSLFISYFGLNVKIAKITKEVCNIWYASTYKTDNFFPDSKNEFLNNKFSSLMISFPPAYENNTDIIEVFTIAPYITKSFWKKQKDILNRELINKVCKILPIKHSYMELNFAASPSTLERYTSNRHGAICGWAAELKELKTTTFSQKTFINGLFLVGHWCTVNIGGKGIPGVASLGKNCAKLVLEYIRDN
jgi:prolycopene isomerase